MPSLDPTDAPRGEGWKAAIAIIAVILVGFAAWALKGILTPLVLAVFLLLMIDGVARVFRDRIPRFPVRMAMPAALVLIVAFFVLTLWVVADNTSQFLAQSSGYEARFNTLLTQIGARLNLQLPPTFGALLQRLDPARFAGAAAKVVQSIASEAFVVLLYLGFLVASRGGFVAKSAKLFRTPQGRDEATGIFQRIRRGVEGYVWVQSVAGLMISISAGVLMAVAGLSHPIFWAFLIFLFNYVPVIGGAVGTLLPPMFALLQFSGFTQPLIIFLGLQLIGFVVGSVIQPRMQGTSLNIDPVVVFLSLAFWSTLWGLTGAFLSTPLTVMAMAILAQFSQTHWIAVLLSSNGEPYPETAKS